MEKIYKYTNYRKFIKDYFFFKKRNTRNFSHRSFSEKAGFSSPNFIKLIIDGKKNLGKTSIPKLAMAMELKKNESDYFTHLVFFNQAKKVVDKNYYFGLLSSIRTPKNVEKLDIKKLEYFRNWYNAIIRELVNGVDVQTINYTELAKSIQPEILPTQVKKSINLLQTLGLLKIEKGRYVQSSPLLETEWENKSFAIRNYHKQLLEIASNSIENIPLDKRNISAITSKVSQKGYARITERIAEFREELMQIISEDEDVNQIYQINFQVFPVSKKEKE
ncbi:MAG: TIGR02147 family protein [Fibrobacteria bacterium]|nr:TIGR02147 family protein [Fibrobacteria bacterium]